MKHFFKAKGYLAKSYLGKEGEKHLTFEVSSSYAFEIAKLELMARDLKNHLPILLSITIKQIEQAYDEESRPKIKRRKFKG